MQFKRHFIDGDYGQLHLRIGQPAESSKRPLLLMHMFPQSGRNFEAMLGAFDDQRIVVAPDFPGHGESSLPPSPISAADYARSIWQVVDALDLLASHNSIDLFGIHAGAKLATEFAHQRPADVNKIILCSAAVLAIEEVEHLKRTFTPSPLDDEGTRFKNLWNILIRNRGPQQSYQMMAASFAEMLRGGEEYEWGHHAVYEFNRVFPEVLQSLPHQIALLNPQDDLYELTPRTVEYLSNGKIYDLPQWGQGFLETNSAEVVQFINDLLDAS